MKFKKIENTARHSMVVLDLLNFAGFLSGTILFLNNIFYINSNIGLVSEIESNVVVVSMVINTVLAFFVMFISVSSPYETDKDGNIYNRLWMMVLYILSLASISTSIIVDDPELLVESTFDIVSSDNMFIDFEIDETDVLDFDQVSTVTRSYIVFFNMAKVFCLAFSSFNILFLLAGVDIFKKNFPKLFKASIFERGFYVGMLVVNIIVLFGAFSYDSGKTDNHFNAHLDTILVMAGETDYIQTFYIGAFTLIVQYFSMLILVAIALILLLFFDNEYQFSMLPMLLLTIQSLIRMDVAVDDGVLFTVSVLLLMFQLPLVVFLLLKQFYKNVRRNGLETLTMPVVNALYRIGNIMSLLSLFFLFIGYMYPWVNMHFKPVSSLTSGVLDNVDDAITKIDGVMADVFDVVSVFDPCYRKNNVDNLNFEIPNSDNGTGLLDSDDDTNLGSTGNYQQHLKKLHDSGASPDAQCLKDVGGIVDWITPFQNDCEGIKDKFDRRIKKYEDDFTNNPENEGNQYTEQDSKNEDSYFVDSHCRSVQCDALLGAGVAAMAVANIPFFGAVGMLMKIASKAVHSVYKVGRKIARVLPKIRKVKEKIQNIGKVVRSLLITTYKSISVTPALAVIYLPILIGAFTTIVLIVIRRRLYVDTSKPVSDQRLQKALSGVKFIFAIWFPIVLSEGLFLGMFSLFKEILLKITKVIPDNLLVADANFLPGYEAMRIAYAIGFVGHSIVLLSALIFVLSNSSFSVLAYINETITGLFKKSNKVSPGSQYKYTRMGVQDKRQMNSFKSFLKDWNSMWLWPLIFSLPVLFIYFYAFTEGVEYVKFSYKGSHQLLSKSSDLSDIVLNNERAEGLQTETDDEKCGLVGKVVDAILKNVKSLSSLTDELANFNTNIGNALDGAKDFLKQLKPLIELPSIPLSVPLFPAIFNENSIIFGLPLFNTLVLVFAYVVTLFSSKFNEGSTIAMLFVQKYDNEEIDDPNSASLLSTFKMAIPFMILNLAVVNIMANEMITALIMFLNEQEMPFIEVNVEISTKYYLSLLASLFNILSVVAFYVNTVFPPEEVVKKQIEDREKVVKKLNI